MQVDAGLSLKFESGARSNKHVFDLKTSKRVYYLAAKTEDEMNKWVSCICSVCGLKMRDEEPENGRGSNRYSPQPSAEKSPHDNASNNSAHLFASVSATSNTRTAHVSSTTSSSRINNNSLDAAALNYSVPRSTSDRLNGNNRHQKEPSNSSEGSGPYIPISECHTGKPGSAKENRPSKNQTLAHPPPSSSISGGVGGNKSNPAVVPIAAKASKSNSHVLRADEFYDVPRGSQPLSGQKDPPPLPNWETFPKDDKNRASSRSCSASFDAKANSGRTAAGTTASSGGQRIRCESGPGEGQGETGANGRISSNPSLRRSATPTTDYMNSSDIPDFAADFGTLQPGSKHPPPRPPKPAILSRSKIDPDSSPPSLTVDCYDIPRTSVEKLSPGKAMAEKKLRTSAPQPNAIPDPTLSLPDILDKTVEVPVLSAAERKALDSYDFPASTKVQVAAEADILDATVALHPSTRSESGRHAYTNSAPGFKATKDSVFIYDYRPSLPTTSDDQIVNFHSPGDPGANDSAVLASAERSPRTPNSGFSEVTPPAVDRNLKPRRKGSDSDATASPTTPNPFLLKPAPDGRRQSGGSFGAVRGSPGSASTLPSVRNKSFTKNNGYAYLSPCITFNPEECYDTIIILSVFPTSSPRYLHVYSRCSHSPQLALIDGTQSRVPGRIAPQIVHSRDASTSEDDAQKSRSSDELVSGALFPV